MDAIYKLTTLGATFEMGMNWSWANGFPTREKAQAFIDWLDEKGMDHRGIYTDDDKFAVRFR